MALDPDLHLEPLPVLRRSGVLSVAVPMGGEGSAMTAGFDPGMNGAMSALRRITTRPPPDPDLQTCDMCAEPIGDDHPHVVVSIAGS